MPTRGIYSDVTLPYLTLNFQKFQTSKLPKIFQIFKKNRSVKQSIRTQGWSRKTTNILPSYNCQQILIERPFLLFAYSPLACAYFESWGSSVAWRWFLRMWPMSWWRWTCSERGACSFNLPRSSGLWAEETLFLPVYTFFWGLFSNPTLFAATGQQPTCSWFPFSAEQ